MSRLVRCLRADAFVLARRPHVYCLPLLFAGLIVMDSVDEFVYMLRGMTESDVWYYFFQSLSYGGLYGPYLGPMLCAIPYSAAIASERHDRVRAQAMARGGRGAYFASKYITATLSGALVYGLAILALTLGLSLMGCPPINAENMEGMEDFYYFDVLEKWPMGYYLIAAWYAFLSGGLYAGFAALVAVRTDSTGAVVVSPLILTFVVIRTCQLFRIPNEWRLDRCLVMRTMPPGLTTGAALAVITLVCLALTAALGAAVVACGRRSARNA